MEDNLSDKYNPINFSILKEHQQVTYIIDVTCKVRFTSLANIFIAQLYNFTCLQEDGLFVVHLTIYKLELKNILILLWKDINIYLYIK